MHAAQPVDASIQINDAKIVRIKPVLARILRLLDIQRRSQLFHKERYVFVNDLGLRRWSGLLPNHLIFYSTHLADSAVVELIEYLSRPK